MAVTWATRPVMAALSKLKASDLDLVMDAVQSLIETVPVMLLNDTASVSSANTGTTLQDTNLVLATPYASTMYIAETFFLYSAGTGGDFKPGWSLPSGSTAHRYFLESLPSTTDTSTGDTYFGTSATDNFLTAPGQTTSTDVVWCRAGVIFTCGSTVGNVRARYAQGASNATGTLCRRGSFMTLRPCNGV